MSAIPKPMDLGTNDDVWNYAAGEYEVYTTATPPVYCGALTIETQTVGNQIKLDKDNSSYEDANSATYDLQVLNSNGGSGTSGTLHFKYKDNSNTEHDFKMTCTTDGSNQVVFTEDASPDATGGGYTATHNM